MKQLILTASLFFLAMNLVAQDSKVSVTLAYPLPIGDNFTSSYTGIADLGLQVRFIDAGPVKIGLSANVNYLSNSAELGTATIKESGLLIQPRAFGEPRGNGKI